MGISITLDNIALRIRDGKLRAEYQSQTLVEYQCEWGEKSARPTAISQPLQHAHPFQSRQMALFDPLWIRYPTDLTTESVQRSQKKQPTAEQLRLYLGPELVKTAWLSVALTTLSFGDRF